MPHPTDLIAFQAGRGDPAPDRSAPTYRHAPDAVGGALAEVGLHIIERRVRSAELEHETAPQAFILARRHAGLGTTR